MALANFLGKSALSASLVLKDFNYENFKQILLSHRIRICFDKKTIASNEGFATVDLLVRLLSRLYPNLNLQCTDGSSPECDHLSEQALAINPEIDLTELIPTVVINVGGKEVDFSCLKFYIGSDQWLAKFSLIKPQLSGHSNNRFGAGAAACFAAANLFRHVFSDQLPGKIDQDFIYSVFNGSIQDEAIQGPVIKTISLEDTVLIGLGAIGNGVAWALTELPISGSLHAVDGERIDLSNLQRYVLAVQNDINQQKSTVIKRYLNQNDVNTYPLNFDEYLLKRGNHYIFRCVVCVDTAEDRRMVQGSLPKKLINAWTQQEQCGVSRHFDFINEPCLACLYHPVKEQKSLPMKIAESLGLSAGPHILMVRDYMAKYRTVDIPLIQLIAGVKGIAPSSLLPYVGKSLNVFYSEVICGGVMIQLTGGTQQEAAEVPAAFESAMAGILLAAELVIDCAQLSNHKPATIHKLNLLRPITRYTYDAVNKFQTPDCICHDDVYCNQYIEKWNNKPKARSHTTSDQVPFSHSHTI